ncbi:hypothetical protein DICPUDRAFT_98314 [Dictyostelium purpureum]|uniref:RING-type domain-containing protein n=1 Tax=Dictyostelium purpureum TaxID=5786 RepID=F0ZPG8_DICPU|nr:uncharacterized protein DICPUDRAFT_98314 [Dictyostelium purpureum]EGC34154.1 hypothetical protein DICPUDRAFT_98314 [Dictyostelium purpureum]|eukprot:XP_003289308.1 hypothetical protein DICPUDRAFT_98314 [Dictyostelium purpureum]
MCKLMKAIKCPVCVGIIKQPQKIKPCKHRVCLECIQSAIKHSLDPSATKCPVCVQIIKSFSLDEFLNDVVEEYISNLKSQHPCQFHPDETYSLLCLCNNTPVCKKCIVEQHSGHSMVDAEGSEEIKESIKKRVEAVKKDFKLDPEIFKEVLDSLAECKEKWEKSKLNGQLKTQMVYADFHKFLQIKEFGDKKNIDEANSIIKYEFDDFIKKTDQKKKDIELFAKLESSDIKKDIYGSILLVKSIQDIDTLINDGKKQISSFPEHANKLHFNQEILQKIKSLSKYLFVPYYCSCDSIETDCQCYQEYWNSPSFSNSQFGKELILLLNPPPLSLNTSLSSSSSSTNSYQPLSIAIYKSMLENTPRGPTSSAKPQEGLSPSDFKQPVQKEDKVNKKQDFIPNTIPKIRCLYFLCGMEDKLHLSRCIKYYPIRDEWAFMPPTKHKRACVTDATIVAKHYIYVFGGNDSLESYEKFNITTGRWENGGNIPSGGGSSMSAAYDGQDSIYLVGGVKFNVTSDRIDRCIINHGATGKEPTLQFQLVTKMKFPRYYCFTLVHDKQLFIIGGTNKTRDDSYFTVINNIEVLSFETKKTTMFVDYLDDHDNRVEGIAFDGVYIYIMTIEHFYTLNIHTKLKGKYLEYPPIENMRFGYSLIIGTDSNSDSVIYLIGDRGSNHYYYKIKENKWYTQQSRRPIASYFHGCGIEYEEIKNQGAVATGK